MPTNRMPPIQTNYSAPSLKAEQCRILYENTLVGIALSLVFSVILNFAYWKEIGTAEIITWNLILYVTLMIRFILWVSWRISAPILPSKFWLWLARIGIWLTGMSWGISTYFLFAFTTPSHQAVFAFALAGVVGCSLPILSMDRYAAVGYVLFAVLPLTVILLRNNDESSPYMAMMTLAFIIFAIKKTEMDRKNIHELFYTKRVLIKKNALLQTNHGVDRAISKTLEQYIDDQNTDTAIRRLLDTLCDIHGYQFAVLVTHNPNEVRLTANNIASDIFLEVLDNNLKDYALSENATLRIENNVQNQGLNNNPKAIYNYAVVDIQHSSESRVIVGNKKNPIKKKDILIEKKIYHALYLLLTERNQKPTRLALAKSST